MAEVVEAQKADDCDEIVEEIAGSLAVAKSSDETESDLKSAEETKEEVFDSLLSVAIVVKSTTHAPALATAMAAKVGVSAQLVACGTLFEDSAQQWTAVVVCESLPKEQLEEMRKETIAKKAIFIMAVTRGTFVPVFVDASRTSLGAQPMFGTITGDLKQRLFEAALDCDSESELRQALGSEIAVRHSAEVRDFWALHSTNVPALDDWVSLKTLSTLRSVRGKLAAECGAQWTVHPLADIRTDATEPFAIPAFKQKPTVPNDADIGWYSVT